MCYLTTAYFLPNRYFRQLLCEAAARGVDVRVLTPGDSSDRPSTWYAASRHHEALLDGGVRLYEYRPTMLHAKTLAVDGIWGMVGTLNFDRCYRPTDRFAVVDRRLAHHAWPFAGLRTGVQHFM